MKTGIVNGKRVEVQTLEQWPCDTNMLLDGLYYTPERKTGDSSLYGVVIPNGDLVLMLRVDHGKDLPDGCESASFDVFGRRVITCWVLTDEAYEGFIRSEEGQEALASCTK